MDKPDKYIHLSIENGVFVEIINDGRRQKVRDGLQACRTAQDG